MKKSPTYLAFQIATLIFFSILAIIALTIIHGFLTSLISSIAPLSSTILVVLIFSIGLFDVVVIVIGFLGWNAECYEIREDEIVHIKGIFAKRKRSYPLARVETINLIQGYIGRALDYGTISLLNPVLPQHRRLNLVGVPQPQQYIELIKHIQEKLTEGSAREASHMIYREEMPETN